MTEVKSHHRPLLSDLIGMIQLADDGENLQPWERARFKEWQALAFGSNKQHIVVHRVGKRIYGAEVWEGIANPLAPE